MKITRLYLRTIKDSRGEPTLESKMISGNFDVISSVPAGKSKGKNEVVSLSCDTALKKFDDLKSKILNKEFVSLQDFDSYLLGLDGTSDKSNLGGNLILVLSICFTKLFAKINNLETHQLIAKILGKKPQSFPYLYFNLIGGGLHAKDSLPFQEYILVAKFPSPTQSLRYAELIVEKLRLDIGENIGYTRFGDEGAFAVKSDDYKLGLEMLKRNLNSQDASLALDVAASSFYQNRLYRIGKDLLEAEKMQDIYRNLVQDYNLLSIEDPFAEDDKENFGKICSSLEGKTLIIGDDLTVTNRSLIEKAGTEKLITGVIIKPNQIGSVSETLEAIKIAKSYNIKIIVSHRSGETMDNFIADLAFGSQAFGLKSGAPTQPQRLAKYNRLIEIEKSL